MNVLVIIFQVEVPNKAPCRQIMLYLDYNATTPLEPEVLESINAALKDAWGNPSSAHDAGTTIDVNNIVVLSDAMHQLTFDWKVCNVLKLACGQMNSKAPFHLRAQMFYKFEPAQFLDHRWVYNNARQWPGTVIKNCLIE